MNCMLYFLFAIWSCVCFARNPIGEKAFYQLDKNRQRTSTILREGSSKFTVTREMPEDRGKRSFQVDVRYQLKILLSGKRQGDHQLFLSEIFFSEELMQILRQRKFYDAKQFKVEYLGTKDAKNLDGMIYRNCDHVKITGFKLVLSPSLVSLVESLENAAAQLYSATSKLSQDLGINGLFSPQAPVFGAVKIDLSGHLDDTPFIAGFDYLQPQHEKPAFFKK